MFLVKLQKVQKVPFSPLFPLCTTVPRELIRNIRKVKVLQKVAESAVPGSTNGQHCAGQE